MSKKVQKVLLIVESIILLFALIVCAVVAYYGAQTSNALYIHAGMIVEYEDCDDGFLVVIYDKDTNTGLTCHVSEDNLSEVCSDEILSILEAQSVGINVKYSLQSYRYKDAQKPDYVYTLRLLKVALA